MVNDRLQSIALFQPLTPEYNVVMDMCGAMHRIVFEWLVLNRLPKFPILYGEKAQIKIGMEYIIRTINRSVFKPFQCIFRAIVVPVQSIPHHSWSFAQHSIGSTYSEPCWNKKREEIRSS